MGDRRRRRFAGRDPGHFTLSTLDEAYPALERGDASGKVVVDIDE